MPQVRETNARRFELYVRWSMYTSLIVVGPSGFVGLVLGAGGAGLTVVLLVEALLLTGLNVAICRWALNRMLGAAGPVPTWFVATLGLLLAITVATLWAGSIAASGTLMLLPFVWNPLKESSPPSHRC